MYYRIFLITVIYDLVLFTEQDHFVMKKVFKKLVLSKFALFTIFITSKFSIVNQKQISYRPIITKNKNLNSLKC